MPAHTKRALMRNSSKQKGAKSYLEYVYAYTYLFMKIFLYSS